MGKMKKKLLNRAFIWLVVTSQMNARFIYLIFIILYKLAYQKYRKIAISVISIVLFIKRLRQYKAVNG